MYPEPLFGGMLPLVLFTVSSMIHVTALVVAASAYLAGAVWVFDRGLRRYSSGSRFSTFG